MISPLDINQKVLKLVSSSQLSAVLTGPATPAFTIKLLTQNVLLYFFRSSAGLRCYLLGHQLSRQRHPGSTSKSHSRAHKALLPDVLHSETPPGETKALSVSTSAFVSTGVSFTQHQDSQEMPCVAVS